MLASALHIFLALWRGVLGRSPCCGAHGMLGGGLRAGPVHLFGEGKLPDRSVTPLLQQTAPAEPPGERLNEYRVTLDWDEAGLLLPLARAYLRPIRGDDGLSAAAAPNDQRYRDSHCSYALHALAPCWREMSRAKVASPSRFRVISAPAPLTTTRWTSNLMRRSCSAGNSSSQTGSKRPNASRTVASGS